MKKYKVLGKFEGKRVDDVVLANSKKQAKLKAGFRNGFGGAMMEPYMRSRSIKVREDR